MEAEGRRLALKSSDIKQQKIKDANQAITDAGKVDPTCEAIAKVATFITLVLTDFDALIELVTDIFKMAACMLIDIAVEIAGVAIDAALASSFPEFFFFHFPRLEKKRSPKRGVDIVRCKRPQKIL